MALTDKDLFGSPVWRNNLGVCYRDCNGISVEMWELVHTPTNRVLANATYHNGMIQQTTIQIAPLIQAMGEEWIARGKPQTPPICSRCGRPYGVIQCGC